jgi:hypothetical protein
MNFLTSQQEVAAHLGLDNTNSNQNTLIKRWINTSQQMIAQAADWPFMRSSTPLIIKTVADYSTGTATVVAASTSVTISATIADSKQGQYIQFADANNWYRITAHTAGTAALTISPSAIGSNTDATYTIRKFHYSLDSTVDRVLSIRQSITPTSLAEGSAESFHLWEPNMTSTGSPRMFYMLGKDTSDSWQIGLYPIPDSVMNLYVEYIKASVDLSSDSDTSVIPAKWHTNVLLKGAIWQGLIFLGDTRAPETRDEFYGGIEEMKRQMLPSRQTHRVMGSVDGAQAPAFSPLGGHYPEGHPWGY